MNYKKKMMLDYLKSNCLDEKWINGGTAYRIQRTAIEAIKSLPAFFDMAILNKTYIRQIELVLTTKCTLKCRDCANLMQHYSAPYDIEVKDLLKSADLFLNKIDKISDFRLLGGEPFIYKDLNILLDELIRSPKIEKITFFTNGTIIPNDKLTGLLKNKKVRIWISNYNLPHQKIQALSEFCRANSINYYVKTDSLQWGYVGEPEAHHRNAKDLQKQFECCNNTCRSLLNGKMFYCPRAAHLDDLGYCTAKENEFLMLNNDTNVEDILKMIYRQHFMSACDYCNYGTADMIPIPPGIQQKKADK